MQDIINEFIEFMHECGLSPARQSDIRSDNKRHNYQLSTATNNKKHGYYKLEISGDFGFGFCGDYRDSECFSWFSKSSKKYSRSEIEALKAKSEKERQKQAQKQLDLYEQKATRAQDDTIFLDDCPDDHPYLVTKGIKSHGLLISGNDIVIPAEDNGKVWSHQTITPNGDKKFLEGARLMGSYFVIKGDDTICIVEGYATGATVHEATGHTVIVAFNASNLKLVAPKISSIYAVKEIIICADNDFESVDTKGEKRNVGLLAAYFIADQIGAKVVFPDFTEKDTGNSDFNDYAKLHNKDKVKEIIHGATRSEQGGGVIQESSLDVQAPPARSDKDDEWTNYLQYDSKGNLKARSPLNARLYIENANFLKGLFRYNSFSKVIMVCYCPPWEDEPNFKVRRLEDKDYFNLLCYLEYEYGVLASKTSVQDSLESVAHNEDNVFNPATEYFNNLEWDGVSRIDDWLINYVSDGKQPEEYLRLVGRKFLCGMAARAITPAVKFDTMIILEGDQYAGKSRLARLLATINGEEYFLDDFRDIENKDTLMKMQGKLIVEFPELTTMRKAEVDDLKAFVTRQSDVFRMPYGRQVVESPRQCVFIGTVNPEGGYLRDVTGNRRYWPVACMERLRLSELEPLIPQLHAEAAHHVKNGEQLWINEEEYKLAVVEQNIRVVDDAWADRIEDIVNGAHTITSEDIMVGLNIPVERRNALMFARIKGVMMRMGYHYGLYQMGAKRKRGYKKKDAPVQADMIEEVIF